MELIQFNAARCDLCGICIQRCPFDALSMGRTQIEVNDNCRMCGMCVRECPQQAIRFEQKAQTVDKTAWNDFLIFVEQEQGRIHPVAFELIGEALKMSEKVGYKVNCVIAGPEGTKENAEQLLQYGVNEVFVYEDECFEGLRADIYANAVADCISTVRPSSVLIGATAFGRSLAPRLSTRFHTGLTADCTTLDITPDTDMIQIRPAFGGNIMAKILITDSRPQFATVRYRVMDKAQRVEEPIGKITVCEVNEELKTSSKINIISSALIEKKRSIEEEDVIVAVGRGVKNEEGLEMCRRLAELLGGCLAYTRPMIEQGIGDPLYQIGLSGHTVRPKLIITCGISGAIQFTVCMNQADTIVAINNDPKAQIFKTASYCLVDDLYEVIPELINCLEANASLKDSYDSRTV